MSELGEIFESANVEKEKIVEIVSALKEDPMSAMAKFNELNLPPEATQKIMGIVMANPGAFDDYMAELGFSAEDVEQMKDQANSVKPEEENGD